MLDSDFKNWNVYKIVKQESDVSFYCSCVNFSLVPANKATYYQKLEQTKHAFH